MLHVVRAGDAEAAIARHQGILADATLPGPSPERACQVREALKSPFFGGLRAVLHVASEEGSACDIVQARTVYRQRKLPLAHERAAATARSPVSSFTSKGSMALHVLARTLRRRRVAGAPVAQSCLFDGPVRCANRRLMAGRRDLPIGPHRHACREP